MTVSIMVGMCTWRSVEPATVMGLWELAKADPDLDLDLVSGDALVTRARSTLATRFLRDFPQDVLVTIDSDIAFAPGAVREIAEQAHELGGIVCAAYATRSWGTGQITAYLADQPIRFAHDPTPVRIRWGAAGFMALPRILFERLRDEEALPLIHEGQERNLEYYPFYESPRATTPDGRVVVLSEDYDICEKAARLDIHTYVNPSIRLGHIGTQMFRLEHLVWKEPPNVPLEIKQQGIMEALFPAEFAPYTRLKAEPEVVPPAASGSHLSRSERRRQEREARKHEPVLALSR